MKKEFIDHQEIYSAVYDMKNVINKVESSQKRRRIINWFKKMIFWKRNESKRINPKEFPL